MVDVKVEAKGAMKPKFDWVLVGLVLLVGLFAGALFFSKTTPVYVSSNVSCPSCSSLVSNETGLSVIYLYPIDCPNCNASRVNAIVSGAGVPFASFMNDAVSYPTILMIYQNVSANQSISTIARASNDFNVISALCLGKNQIACNLKDGITSVMQSCLQKNNLPLDTVIYYYSDWCGTLCNNMNSSLSKLEQNGYRLLRLNEKFDSPAKECLKDFLNYAGGFPQFVCPKRVIAYTGAMDSNSLESFADNCKN
jgi:hypothetical protein